MICGVFLLVVATILAMVPEPQPRESYASEKWLAATTAGGMVLAGGLAATGNCFLAPALGVVAFVSMVCYFFTPAGRGALTWAWTGVHSFLAAHGHPKVLAEIALASFLLLQAFSNSFVVYEVSAATGPVGEKDPSGREGDVCQPPILSFHTGQHGTVSLSNCCCRACPSCMGFVQKVYVNFVHALIDPAPFRRCLGIHRLNLARSVPCVCCSCPFALNLHAKVKQKAP